MAWLGRTLFWSALPRRGRLALGLGCSAVGWLGGTLFRGALLGRGGFAFGLGCSAVGRLGGTLFRGALLGRGTRFALSMFAGPSSFRFTRRTRSMRTRTGSLSWMTLIRTSRLLLIRVLRAAAIGSVAFGRRSGGTAGGLRCLWASRMIAGRRGCAGLLRRHRRGMIRSSGSFSSYYSASAEYTRFCRGSDCGCAVIVRREQGLVLTGGVLLPNLGCDRRRMLFAGILFFPGSRAGRDATFTAVEGDMGFVVDDDCPVDVDVGDVH